LTYILTLILFRDADLNPLDGGCYNLHALLVGSALLPFTSQYMYTIPNGHWIYSSSSLERNRHGPSYLLT
jgi:hypothetical protein